VKQEVGSSEGVEISLSWPRLEQPEGNYEVNHGPEMVLKLLNFFQVIMCGASSESTKLNNFRAQSGVPGCGGSGQGRPRERGWAGSTYLYQVGWFGGWLVFGALAR
jgi:hypothetical protein